MQASALFSKKEVRRLVRQQLNGNHGIHASVEINQNTIPITLSDISSLGFAASIQGGYGERFSIGERITLKVEPLRQQAYWVHGLIIDKQSRADSTKIACVIQHDQAPGHGKFAAIQLQSEQFIKGQLLHPFLYQQNYFFEVDRLSKQGFSLTNISSDCLLFSGMKIQLKLGACDSAGIIEGVVSEITVTDSNQLRCFLRLPAMGKKMRNDLTQYLFHYLSVSPRELKSAGFNSYCLKELVHYKFVETQEEYDAVLKIRRKNYSGNNKVAADSPLEKLSYFFDRYSRIVMVCHRDKLIGSATMIMGEEKVRPSEIEVVLPADEFNQLPPPEELVEVASLCLNEEYRNTDILHGLFEHLYINATMTGRRYLMMSSDNELLRLYKGIGFKDTGLSFIQPKYNDLPMKVLLGDTRTAKCGKGMNPIVWWGMWGKSSRYLSERGVIRYSVFEKLRVQASRILFEMVMSYRSGFRKCKKHFEGVGFSNKQHCKVVARMGDSQI